jgi:hypothetical protein
MPDHSPQDGPEKPPAPSRAGKETRRRARRKVTGLVLECHHAGGSTRASGTRVNIARELIDISPGGLQFICSEALARPCSLSLQIKDPDSGEAFHASGDVMWCHTEVDQGVESHHIGVQFDEIFTTIAKCTRFFYGPGTMPMETAAPEIREKPKGREHRPRRSERFPVDDYVVTLWKEAPFWNFAKPKNIATRVVDLSAEGAHVECSEKLEPGAKVHFTLHLNKFEDTFSADAEVVWARKLATRDIAAWRSGLHFRKLNRRQQMLIDHMMSWFSSQRAKLRQPGPK